MNIDNTKLTGLTALLLLVLSHSTVASTLTLQCDNNTQVTCAKEAYELDDEVCEAPKRREALDLNLQALLSNGQQAGDDASTNATAWLSSAQHSYQVCMALANQPAMSTDSWSNQILLGYMFQSDYNDQGEHLGLEEQSAVAQIAFNGRWLFEEHALMHWEVGAVLGKTAANIEPDDSEDENDTDTDTDTGNGAGGDAGTMASKTPSFNDVDGSLDIYTKITYSPEWALIGNEDTLSSYFTFGALAGFRTRDVLTDEKDGVLGYVGLIGEYYYFGKDVRINGNDIPRGRVMLGPVYFEEYGGAEHELRWLFVGEWNVTGGADGDLVVGVRANLGKGSDDIGVFAAIRKPLSSLKGFFGFKG